MSAEIQTHVVTIRFHEETLTEINELSNHLTRAGFTLVLNDDEGKPHELGTNTFGLVSPTKRARGAGPERGISGNGAGAAC
ncbi:Protein of uncharacterised function (DUF2622) [Raoultella terrigena]|uniref:Protein of uncharacterized function (DUF2622) n=1 Tax=Raoultella terrigena TaxID=577 RepID=A0A4U9CWH8_RAOTE|nr:Protein of uncharacterised function (DUF2622) [Raoultella terrigena]